MTAFIIRRLLFIPPLLFGVALVTFSLLRASPGDYFQQMEMDPNVSLDDLLGQKESAGLVKRIDWSRMAELGDFEVKGNTWRYTDGQLLRDGTPIDLAAAGLALGKFELQGLSYRCSDTGGLYQSVGPIEGFVRWLGNACVLDFGRSLKWRRPVFELIWERLLNTLSLSLCALVLAWGISIPLGVLAAVRPNTLPDYMCSLLAFLGLSIPSVFFALLMVLFASYTGWFPIGDMRDVVNYDSFSTWEKFLNRLHHLILPTIVIGTAAMAQYMRQARGNMVEALSQDYVRTARAKGLPSGKVLFKHALRNAINPLVTLFGYSLAALLSGSFLVEVVMNWPGMARLVVEAILAKDEPVVMAAVLFSSLLLILGNLVADLLLAVVDPRVRLS